MHWTVDLEKNNLRSRGQASGTTTKPSTTFSLYKLSLKKLDRNVLRFIVVLCTSGRILIPYPGIYFSTDWDIDISQALITAIMRLYGSVISWFCKPNGFSDLILSVEGLKQGCTLFPNLIRIYIESWAWLVSKGDDTCQWIVHFTPWSKHLLSLTDFVLIASSLESLQSQFDSLDCLSDIRKLGLLTLVRLRIRFLVQPKTLWLGCMSPSEENQLRLPLPILIKLFRCPIFKAFFQFGTSFSNAAMQGIRFFSCFGKAALPIPFSRHPSMMTLFHSLVRPIVLDRSKI